MICTCQLGIFNEPAIINDLIIITFKLCKTRSYNEDLASKCKWTVTLQCSSMSHISILAIIVYAKISEMNYNPNGFPKCFNNTPKVNNQTSKIKTITFWLLPDLRGPQANSFLAHKSYYWRNKSKQYVTLFIFINVFYQGKKL